MNLQMRNNNVVGAFNRATAAVGCFLTSLWREMFPPNSMMPLTARFQLFAASITLAAVLPLSVFAQTNYYTTNGTEYAVIGSLPGDQMFPDVALSTNGGFVVWQDNATDGDGWGISARQVDNTLSGTLSTFRVNAQGANDQENARVTLLKNGGAAFVWQGGIRGSQRIFARYLSSGNTWLTATDLVVSTFTNGFQINPAIATLNNSNVVVVWSSFNQAGTNSLLDVYAKILSPSGDTVQSEFLVNQFTSFNQRSPAVAALANGGFVVTWVSEQQRLVAPLVGATNSAYSTSGSITVPSVDIYARVFQNNGVADGNEFVVNQSFNPCANPAVAGASDGSFMVAWSGRDMVTFTNGWDVYARSFSNNLTGDAASLVNSHVAGNQYAPRLVSIGLDYLVVWTSLGQDGSREGVYGQLIHNDGTPTGGEFRVNTTTASQQMQPVVASDGANQFLAVWTSFAGLPNSFDLYAQRYINANGILLPMPAPFVYAPFNLSNNVYQPQLQVSWTPLLGISVSNYQVFVDNAATPMAVTTSNVWIMTAENGLSTNSTHSFQVDYVRMDGRVSPMSPSSSGTTWGGGNYFGLPYEWMAANFGGYNASTGKYSTNFWPAPNVALAPGGLTLLQVFLSGGDPYDSSTWLQTSLVRTAQGFYVNWNAQPGFTYQVQTSTNLETWQNLGSPRFAAGTNDSVFVGNGSAGYYRVYLLR